MGRGLLALNSFAINLAGVFDLNDSSNASAGDGNSRRNFLNIFLSGGFIAVAGSLLYPLFRFFTPPPQEEAVVSSVKLGKVDDFPINSGRIFRFGSKPGIIIRDANGKFRAFTATCTHLDCIVQYDAVRENIWCACHNGRYDLNGTNISGPPPRPLTKFQVNILPESGELVVSLEDGVKV